MFLLLLEVERTRPLLRAFGLELQLTAPSKQYICSGARYQYTKELTFLGGNAISAMKTFVFKLKSMMIDNCLSEITKDK